MRAWYALLGAVAAGLSIYSGAHGWTTATGAAALSAVTLVLYSRVAPR